ncbi:MAG: DUF4091 domain-containing protein [Chitinophagaceae bacterium]|nr:DUF4091 domain-containing protein [Chitinophagaceae bacterium]
MKYNSLLLKVSFRKMFMGLIFLMSLGSLSCNQGDKQDSAANKEVNVEGNNFVRLTSMNSMERIGLDQSPFGTEKVDIKGAKNETISFQVAISATHNAALVTQIECTDLQGKSGIISKENIRLYREIYVLVREPSPRAQLPPGLYPDPLVPLANPYKEDSENLTKNNKKIIVGIPFTVWKEQNQPIWVDISIPKSAISDKYSGLLKVTYRSAPSQWGVSKEDASVRSVSIPISLNVWDFSLPDAPVHDNHFGGLENISQYFNVIPNSKEFREIELRYSQLMADNGINPPLPSYFFPEMKENGHLNIVPEKTELLKEFIQKLNISNFPVPMPNIPKEEMITTDRNKAINYFKDYYQYIKTNGWDKSAYLYMYDEPNTKEAYEMVLELGNVVHEGAPFLRRLVVEQTYPQDSSWVDIDPSVDIWCPLFAFIDPKTIDEKLSQGDEVWSYTAISQRTPDYDPNYNQEKDYDPPYWHTDNDLSSYRIPTWINWQYKITGLLYWSTMTDGVNNPWLFPGFIARHGTYNGGGFLIYPGTECGIKGPIASIRLKNIRDGLTDYKYFTILESLAGREFVTNLVSKIAPNWWGINYNSQSILSVREEIAHQIMKFKKK